LKTRSLIPPTNGSPEANQSRAKRRRCTALAVFGVLLLALAACKSPEARLYDVSAGDTLKLGDALSRFKETRIVLVGEHHTDERHHANQLAVIRALHEAGVEVAVVMEMFRAETQPQLDRWVGGEMSEADFEKVYWDNWNYPWKLYRGILRYAREQGIPVVGLNVARGITRQVAREGFASLTAAQRGQLPPITCAVDRTYMEFIKRAYGAHSHGQMNFTNFCEAQLVWDTAMATYAAAYLRDHPRRVMVIAAGTGHVWKGGIPRQLEQYTKLPHLVILPEIEGSVTPGSISRKDADFIFLAP